MTTSEQLKNAIEFAIDREQEASDFYYRLAEKVKNNPLATELRKLGAMEEGHRDKLKNLDVEEVSTKVPEEIVDLKISDYLVAKDPTPDMSWQDILIIVMKREEAAKNLYTTLSEIFSVNPPISNLFQNLAKEESEHKLYFEKMYDDDIFTEN